LLCDPGFHTNNATSATTCTPCDGGFYSTGATAVCSTCEAGMYSIAGQAACAPCKPGFYAASTGSPICTQCRQGFFSLDGASSCELAGTGHYLQPANDTISLPCPRGVACSGGREMPLPQRNFWADRNKGPSLSTHLFECMRKTCTGAVASAQNKSTCWTIDDDGA